MRVSFEREEGYVFFVGCTDCSASACHQSQYSNAVVGKDLLNEIQLKEKAIIAWNRRVGDREDNHEE